MSGLRRREMNAHEAWIRGTGHCLLVDDKPFDRSSTGTAGRQRADGISDTAGEIRAMAAGHGNGDGGVDQRLGRTATKLGLVTASPDRWQHVFGVEAHGFQLNPPLAEETVTLFESDHGVDLPEAYRRFVTRLGDGGAGPDYGLLPLGDDVSDKLAAPSVIEPGLERLEHWSEQFYKADVSPWQGTLTVVDHGCTVRTLLIVTGPWRGRLVHADVDGRFGPYMLEDEDFLAWYERWLDELTEGCDVGMFGWQKLPGDEDFLRTALASDPSPSRRERAARSLAALPELSRDGWHALLAASSDTDPLARQEVVEMVAKVKMPGAEALIRAALADPDPRVRKEAVQGLNKVGVADREQMLRQMLTDPDVAVVNSALWPLASARTLRLADLTPLLEHADSLHRRRAAFFLLYTQDEVTDVLRDLISGDDPHMRASAVRAAVYRRERRLLPDVQQLAERGAAVGDVWDSRWELRDAVTKLSE
ncbi:HEAT repeat domain-containing protein [Catellatospora aurea]|uniref:HEAT repeat domain-containing protein n=1 Tax=Catellatospora aurea TaxID=1337874 RepID=A0ABW2H442_9ACTN